jgi:hypothetical protein
VLVLLEANYPGTLRLDVFGEATATVGTSEYSPIEIAQVVILAACGAILALIARDYPSQRPPAVLFGGVALVCMIRELDYFLDRLVAENAWQILVGVVAALAIAYCYRHRKRLAIALARLWPSSGLVMLFAGATLLFAVVRFVGSEALWQAIMGDGYRHVVAAAVDEFVELSGYLLWFVGTIEYSYEVRALAGREPEPAAVKRRRTQLGRHR